MDFFQIEEKSSGLQDALYLCSISLYNVKWLLLADFVAQSDRAIKRAP